MAHSDTLSTCWTQIQENLRSVGGVSEFAMDAYLAKLTLVKDNGTTLTFSYPADMLIDWVEVNYREQLIMAATHVFQGARRIEFMEEGSNAAAECEQAEPQAPVAKPARAKRQAPRRVKEMNSGLNTDYTFDNFIVGVSNNFAYSASMAVAMSKERLYSPLFIYGESGLGKTHLMQAIGNAIRERDEHKQVLYLTGETFMNDYIEALSQKGEHLKAFRRKYRRADVLLIDDIQFIARAGKTQEEFFHTFNELFENGKQIVLTADCPASDIVNMDARLVTRFEQGLAVALLPPDYETRMAILRSKLRQWKSDLLAPEVPEFLAKNITHSVRALEGALVRLTTYATFCHRCLTVADARAQLSDLLRHNRGETVSIETIQQRVAEEFKVRVADINGRRRTADIALCRQVAMFLARKHTERSLQDVGAAFGGRDHGTVLHAERAIASKMASDTELRERIMRLSEALV